MSKPDAPKHVTALFSFKGKNNDELCFKKGDVITITQTDDEGWWEGTLHDKTGWFPSNYVKECRVTDQAGFSSVKSSPEKSPQESPVHQKLNRDIVLKDIVDSERINVAELQGLVNNFLQPLESTNILKKDEYKQLLGNIHEILEMHQRLLTSVESALAQGPSSRIGNLFLTLAQRMKAAHVLYCSNHPRAVCILDRYRDELNEFMERSGAISPGILVLTTGLSKPFRRLDKYSAMLQELERYTEKNHPDRGDTQRSIAVYREIADRCASIRKQRELALHVLTSGIKGWEGEELTSLGEILHVGSVIVANGVDRRDRYFVLFPTTLLVLSTSPRMSSFVYEGKLPLTGISITQTEETDELKNAFEITGPMIESIVVLCPSKEDRQRWTELLIQEQTTSLLKSPTMHRVSYTKHPYARLSRYFAKLVKEQIIRPELMKKLLYLQYVLKPDFSNVKMRKPNVTIYSLCPTRSNYSDASSSESDVDREQRQPLLRKSTLTLDVKYSLEDVDLSTVGVTSDSFYAGSTGAYENSKSLPTAASPAAGPHNFDSRSANLLPRSYPSTRDHSKDRLDDAQEQLNSGITIRYWKTIEFSPKDKKNTDDRTHSNTCRNEIGDSYAVGSMRSLDSGMAESCRLNSSEINCSCKSYTSNNYNTGPARSSCSGSENGENQFEHQCICTSPFDSTPRGSYHLSDLTKSIDDGIVSSVCDRNFNDVTSNVSGKEVGENAAAPTQCGVARSKRFTDPIPYAHQIGGRGVVRRVGRKATQLCPRTGEDFEQPSQLYTSGLYAHWWLKKPIPVSGWTGQAMLCEQTSNQLNGTKQQQRPLVDHCSSPGIKMPWSVASLRPAPPLYTLKTFGKSDTTLDLSRAPGAPRICNERQFEEDGIILKVIEGYYLSVNARFTVHSGESNSVLDYDSQKTRDRVSLVHNRGNWDSCSNRTLSETVKILENRMTDLQSQMSLLTKQLDEERRSRLSLAATVKRSIGVADGSIP